MSSTQTRSIQIRETAYRNYVEPARQRGESIVAIKAGNIVHDRNLKNMTPSVCSALRSKVFQRQYGLQLIGEQGPPSGMSTTMVFTYKILKNIENNSNRPTSSSVFAFLRGIGKGTFKKLGGGEEFIRGERQDFLGNSPTALNARGPDTRSLDKRG